MITFDNVKIPRSAIDRANYYTYNGSATYKTSKTQE